MASAEESIRASREESARSNKSLALDSYRIGTIGAFAVGLGTGAEIYSAAAESWPASIPGIMAIAWGVYSVRQSRQDIDREIGWALEDQAKAAQIPAAAVTEAE